MTIAKRLMLLVGAYTLVSLLTLTFINYQQMNKVFDAANHATINVVPSLDLLIKASSDYGRLRARVFRHVLATDPAEMAEIEKTLAEAHTWIGQSLKKYEEYIADAEDKRLLEVEKSSRSPNTTRPSRAWCCSPERTRSKKRGFC